MADPSSSFDDCSPLEVADAIGQLGSAMSAIHRQVLALVALADERGDWREDGANDMAGWLCARLGLRSGNAAEWVRVAHALESLPECGRAYGGPAGLGPGASADRVRRVRARGRAGGGRGGFVSGVPGGGGTAGAAGEPCGGGASGAAALAADLVVSRRLPPVGPVPGRRWVGDRRRAEPDRR